MSKNNVQVNVRMPHEIVEDLKAAAADSRRSMTAQLNLIVEEWLKTQKESLRTCNQ